MTRMLAIFVFIFSALGWCFPTQGGIRPVAVVAGKDTIDFGSFAANVRQRGVFKIANIGNAELKIIDIRKTCGCAIANIASRKIKPGTAAELTAEILPDSVSGPFSKNIYLETNDPEQRFLRVTLSGNALPLVTIYPKNFIYMGTLVVGKEYEYKLRIDAGKNGVNLEIGEQKANFKMAIKLIRDSPRQFTVIIKVLPLQQSERLSAELKLNVLEPKGWKPLPVNLQGRTAI